MNTVSRLWLLKILRKKLILNLFSAVADENGFRPKVGTSGNALPVPLRPTLPTLPTLRPTPFRPIRPLNFQ
jgi:hypothetical protein